MTMCTYIRELIISIPIIKIVNKNNVIAVYWLYSQNYWGALIVELTELYIHIIYVLVVLFASIITIINC